MLKLRFGAVATVTVLAVCAAARAATSTDLQIKVTATSFRVGSNGVYTLTVRNLGGGAADDVIAVTSGLPAGLSFLSTRSRGWTCSAAGQALTCTNVDGIPAGGSLGLSLSVSVGGAAAPGVTTSFTVAYAADTNLSNNTSTKATIVKPGTARFNPPTTTPGLGTPSPTRTPTPLGFGTPTPTAVATDLFISMLSSGFFITGGTGTYVINVWNDGDADTNVPITVTDTLPNTLSFVSASGLGWMCSNAGQTVTCVMRSPLLAGESTNFITLLVNISSAAYPSITNFATADYPSDINIGNNIARRPTTVRRGRATPIVLTATPVPGTPTRPGATPTATRTRTRTPTPSNAAATDLLLTKTSAGSFRVGGTGIYTLTVTNIGTKATNVPFTVVDTLPDSLRPVSAVGPGWACEIAGQTVRCIHPNAITPPAGAAVSLSVSVTRAAFPTVTNTATLEYVGDIDMSNNVAKRPTTVRQ